MSDCSACKYSRDPSSDVCHHHDFFEFPIVSNESGLTLFRKMTNEVRSNVKYNMVKRIWEQEAYDTQHGAQGKDNRLEEIKNRDHFDLVKANREEVDEDDFENNNNINRDEEKDDDDNDNISINLDEQEEHIGEEEVRRRREPIIRVFKDEPWRTRQQEVLRERFGMRGNRIPDGPGIWLGLQDNSNELPSDDPKYKEEPKKMAKAERGSTVGGDSSSSNITCEVRWTFVRASNILPERYLCDATVHNQIYMDIISEAGINALLGDIGPHWPSIVKDFICNISKDITNPSSPLFQKVVMRSKVFNFSPLMINRYYGRQNAGITGSNLKLNDIVKTLTGGVLNTWPTKGQLPASSLSLRYAVLHKVVIANLLPTSNNINVSEPVGRMMYVMGTGQELDFGRIIFYEIIDHSRTGPKLKPIGYPSLICGMLLSQHPEILQAEDGPREDAKPLTITDKLMSGKIIVDVEVQTPEKPETAPEGEVAALLIKAYVEEKKFLEADILQKRCRLVELQVKICALQMPEVDDTYVGDRGDDVSCTPKYSPICRFKFPTDDPKYEEQRKKMVKDERGSTVAGGSSCSTFVHRPEWWWS